MMEPRHCRPGPEGRGRQCFRSAWSEVVSAAFGRQLMTFWCDLEALVDTMTRARSDLAARCPRKRYPRWARKELSRQFLTLRTYLTSMCNVRVRGRS